MQSVTAVIALGPPHSQAWYSVHDRDGIGFYGIPKQVRGQTSGSRERAALR
jgi:hypothetical protein